MSNSNEHILLSQEGVLRCRSVGRLEVAERYSKKIMENAKGLPWDHRPPRDHADGGPFEGREPPRGTPGQSDEQRVGTGDREQNLHSSMRLVDRAQAARHAWE